MMQSPQPRFFITQVYFAPMTKKDSTSWGGVADWYDEHLTGSDTYHEKVIAPNLLRIVAPDHKRILEIGCGQGYFSKLFSKAGGIVFASDISKELIEIAREKNIGPTYFVAPADEQYFVIDGMADVVVAVLTLQNMERIDTVMKEVARVLKPQGRFVCVINHPAFRIPKATHWEYDERTGVQYRRVEKYMSSQKVPMEMHPGHKALTGKGSTTYSFHRSLQDFMKAFSSAGFGISRIEEWVSHKSSQKGPRAHAEDTARKEFPLFMCIECVKID